jgi:branched-chain amino acid transport system ATP-binding protein
MALKYSRYGYILENGAEGKRKSFREGKHYKRRKRWLA